MYRSQQCQRTVFVLLLGGLGACASTGSPAAQSAEIATSVHSDAQILAVLHQSDVGEISASTLAQQRATDPAVKLFATMMVTEHTSLDEQGNRLAQQINASSTLPDSTLLQVQRKDSTALSAAPAGAAFDRTYITQQVAAHQRTLEVVDASIPIAKNAAIKTALQSQVRPAVTRHLARARELQSHLGGVAASRDMSPNAARPATSGVSNGAVTENPADSARTPSSTPSMTPPSAPPSTAPGKP